MALRGSARHSAGHVARKCWFFCVLAFCISSASANVPPPPEYQAAWVNAIRSTLIFVNITSNDYYQAENPNPAMSSVFGKSIVSYIKDTFNHPGSYISTGPASDFLYSSSQSALVELTVLTSSRATQETMYNTIVAYFASGAGQSHAVQFFNSLGCPTRVGCCLVVCRGVVQHGKCSAHRLRPVF
jgi:hypothetical protein